MHLPIKFQKELTQNSIHLFTQFDARSNERTCAKIDKLNHAYHYQWSSFKANSIIHKENKVNGLT